MIGEQILQFNAGRKRVREIKETAFGKYLLGLSRQDAISYLGRCFFDGPADSVVWELLAASGVTVDSSNHGAWLDQLLTTVENA